MSTLYKPFSVSQMIKAVLNSVLFVCQRTEIYCTPKTQPPLYVITYLGLFQVWRRGRQVFQCNWLVYYYQFFYYYYHYSVNLSGEISLFQFRMGALGMGLVKAGVFFYYTVKAKAKFIIKLLVCKVTIFKSFWDSKQ